MKCVQAQSSCSIDLCEEEAEVQLQNGETQLNSNRISDKYSVGSERVIFDKSGAKMFDISQLSVRVGQKMPNLDPLKSPEAALNNKSSPKSVNKQ